MKHLRKDVYSRTQLFRAIIDEMDFRGINHKELAAKIGVDPSNLNRYLKGVTCPSLDIFTRICDALYLHISLGYLR